MGIRVDAQSLSEQLKKAGCEERRSSPFHKLLLDGTLPLTMGGGIGQSRLCMLLLGQGPHRRGPMLHLGSGHGRRLQKGRRSPAVNP